MEGFRTDAVLIATVAIDAINSIWRHDYKVPARKPKSAPLDYAEFLDRFAADPATGLICVVFLAQDMAASRAARLHPMAQRLLRARAADDGPPPSRPTFREWPHTHKDCTWSDLVTEEPALAAEKELERAAKEYTRGALAYRLFRCGTAHHYSRGDRTSDFSSGIDAEISYSAPMAMGGRIRPIGVKLGIGRLTTWLRACATNYATECTRHALRPATNFDASRVSLTSLASVWRTVR